MTTDYDKYAGPELDEELDNLEPVEIEIEDDTPPEDRGREPLPEPLLKELEADELEGYDEGVKRKLKQMRKVWHDERRAKEAAFREQAEAIEHTKRLMYENQRLRATLTQGGQEYASMLNTSAEQQMASARQAYKDAYESGDTERLLEANEALQAAQLRLIQAKNFRAPTLQPVENQVQHQQQAQQPSIDPKTQAWQERNEWFGTDDEMTAAALGLHEKIRRSGDVAIGSDEYYAILDKTIRRRFPEYFDEQDADEGTKPRPATVVAPAVRSSPTKRIRLTASQVRLAKRLGVTPEQYALEVRKMESRNG